MPVLVAPIYCVTRASLQSQGLSSSPEFGGEEVTLALPSHGVPFLASRGGCWGQERGPRVPQPLRRRGRGGGRPSFPCSGAWGPTGPGLEEL